MILDDPDAVIDGEPFAHYVCHVTEVSPITRDAAYHPVARRHRSPRLLGPEAWLLEDDRFGVVYQDARPGEQSGYSRIGWHSDAQSGPNLRVWPSVAFTIHVDATSPRNGFLRVVPGSHLGGTDEMPLGFEHVPGEMARLLRARRRAAPPLRSLAQRGAGHRRRRRRDPSSRPRRVVRRRAPRAQPRRRRLRQERPPLTSSATRDLRALPKGHLHVHLEGAMRPSTLAELADAAGIPVPEIRGYGSFTAFSDTYLAACQVLQTPEDFARLVYEVVEDSVLDGAVWVEPSFYAPHHRDRFGTDEDIIDMVLDAAAAAAEQLGRRRRA